MNCFTCNYNGDDFFSIVPQYPAYLIAKRKGEALGEIALYSCPNCGSIFSDLKGKRILKNIKESKISLKGFTSSNKITNINFKPDPKPEELKKKRKARAKKAKNT